MGFKESTLRLFQYYIGGNLSIYYNITIGGEGSTETPNFYYVINGRPLDAVFGSKMICEFKVLDKITWFRCHLEKPHPLTCPSLMR